MRLPYETDDGAARRAALGLIVLQVDEVVEADFRSLLDLTGVRLLHSRIPSGADLTAETIPRMKAALTAAAALLPAAAELDAIGYACTSGAAMLGEAAVEGLIAAAHPGVRVTTPLAAVKAACRSLGIGRLGLVSPYVAAVSDSLRAALEESGIAVTAAGSFEQQEERLVARITPLSVHNALIEIGARDECDAVFASCTNLRAVEAIADAEQELGKPVFASNQVLAWHLLRLAGLQDQLPGAGALARAPLP